MDYDIEIPEFYTDPKFTGAQDFLFPYGTDIMKGDIPDYYKGIGEIGGPIFEDYLSSVKTDITRAGLETGARLRKRGPGVASGISKAISGVLPGLRWQEILRGLKGREWLFGEGRGITEGVRGAGLTYGGQKSQYGLQKSGLEFQVAEAQAMREERERERERAEKAAKDKMWSDIISSAIGGISTMGASYFLGPAKTATKMLGSAGGGGYDPFAGLDLGKDLGDF